MIYPVINATAKNQAVAWRHYEGVRIASLTRSPAAGILTYDADNSWRSGMVVEATAFNRLLPVGPRRGQKNGGSN